MIYYVDHDTGEIESTSRQALEDGILDATHCAYTAAQLARLDVSELAAIAAKIPALDGYCFSRGEAESLSKAFRPAGD